MERYSYDSTVSYHASMEQQTDECCVESITILSDGGETTISKLVGRKYGGLDFINVSNAGCNENDNDFRDVEYYDQRDAYTRLGLERSEDQDPAQDFGAIDIPIKAKNKSFKDESSISSDRSTLSSITNNDVVPMYDDTGHFVAFQDKTTQEAQMQVLQQQLLLHHQQSHLTVPHLPMHLYRQPSLGTRQPSLSLTLQTPPMQRGGKLQSSKTDTTSTLPSRSHNLVGNNFVESQEHVDPMMPVASALRSQLQYDDAISDNIINGFNACFCCKVGGLIALFAVVACSATATWFVITDRVSFVDGKLNINIESGGNLEQGDSVELSTLAPSLTPRVRISKSGKLGISMFGQSNQNSLSPTQMHPEHETNSDMRTTLQPTLSKGDKTDSPSQQSSAHTRRPLSKPKTLSLTDGPTLSPSETSVTEGSTPSQQINKPKRRPTSRPVTPNPTNELTPSQSETSAIEEQQTNTPKRRPSLQPIAPSPADEPTPSPSEFVVMNPKDDLTYESSIAAEDMPTEMPVIGDVNEAPSSPRTTSPNEVTFPPTYNTPAPSVLDPIITTLMPISSPSSAPDFDHQVQVELMTSKPTPIELDTEELTESPIVELMTPSSTPSVKQSSNPTDQQITTEPTETPVELMTPPPIPPADKESPSPTNSPIATPLTSSPSPSPTLKAVQMTPTPTLSQIDTDDPTESPDDQKAPHSLLPAETSSNPTDPPIITPLTFVPTQEVEQVTPSPTLSQIDMEDPTESPAVQLLIPSSIPDISSNPIATPLTSSPSPSPTQEVEQVTPSPTQGEMETEAPTRTLVELMTPSPIQQADTSSSPTDPPVIMPLTASPTREVLRMTSSPTPSEIDMEDPTESSIELMTPLPTPPAPTESTPDPTPYPTFESTQDSTPAQSVLELITDTPTEEIIDENEVW